MDDFILKKFQDNILKNDDSLSQIILHLNEMDRKRIARDLHDSTIQNMVCMIHKVELATKFIDFDPIRAKLELASINQVIHENIEELRELVYDLRPMIFDDLGFDVLLKEYIDELNDLYENEIDYKNDVDFSNIDSDFLITIYRIIKECCINSIKHSGGGKLTIRLTEKDGQLHIIVADDGRGCDLSDKVDPRHYGLQIVRDRVTLLNGRLEIHSEILKGYRTYIWIPFDRLRM